MDDKEQGIMALYRETRPAEYAEASSTINQLAWSLLVIALGVIFWLLLALINAENQRYALMTRQCQDRVFPAELDTRCLSLVRSRPHWWQHVGYAMTHVRP